MATRLWLWQRYSAVLLFVLVGAHFGVNHFLDPTAKITFGLSQVRLQSLGYLVVDSLLLVVGLFHGLNGLRGIVLDYWPRAAAAATWALTLGGVALFVYGALSLARFLA